VVEALDPRMDDLKPGFAEERCHLLRGIHPLLLIRDLTATV